MSILLRRQNTDFELELKKNSVQKKARSKQNWKSSLKKVRFVKTIHELDVV